MSSSLSQVRKCTTWSFWRQSMMALLLLMLLGAPAASQTFDEAIELYERGDYAAAFEAFRVLAEQGNTMAQYILGLMYATDKGAPQDATEAMRWFRLAADQGYAGAQYELGVMYAKGQGVPQDYTEAMRCTV